MENEHRKKQNAEVGGSRPPVRQKTCASTYDIARDVIDVVRTYLEGPRAGDYPADGTIYTESAERESLADKAVGDLGMQGIYRSELEKNRFKKTRKDLEKAHAEIARWKSKRRAEPPKEKPTEN
ncbi:hypothetical protein ACJIZ3_014449 [Penstemon smallii]|uniref:Uncharacterized protein n=1 Tax=Penstemon smallii TaxID=265156 RepID=A0ABD3RN11_9LAMI